MKTKRIFVAVPIVVSEDGKHCSNNCEYHFGRMCDLAGKDWDELGDNKRFPVCRAAERRMNKMLGKARKEMEDFPSNISSGWDIKKSKIASEMQEHQMIHAAKKRGRAK